MHDSELKKLLLETCPVRPGQENRAWTALRERLHQSGPTSSPWAWLYLPTWRGAVVGLAALIALALLGNSLVVSYQPISYASADSRSPGIYATSFYSRSAQAQVVWLDGLKPATDQPAYLEPTTGTASPAKKNPTTVTPNSL